MPDIQATVRRRATRGAVANDAMHGFMRTLPQVGAPLVLYVPEPGGGLGRLVTSLVQRVLMDASGTELFVETRRSTYVVTLEEPAAVLPPPARSGSFDGYETTTHPAGANDPGAKDHPGEDVSSE